jgi:transposase
MINKDLDLNQCLYVGIDAHKDFHLALVCNRFEEKLGSFEVPNNLKEIKKFVKQMEALAHQKKSLTTIFGIENSRGNGELLTQYLLNNNNIVYEVNPVRTHQGRQKTVFRDKSDIKDAEKIVSELTRKLGELPLLTKESENTLYTAIQELSLYRDDLVREQTAIKNQLHNLFHKDDPDYKERFKTVFSQRALRYWQARAKRKEKENQEILLATRATLIKMKIKRFYQIIQEIKTIEAKLKPLILKTGQKLETLRGVDVVAAAKIIGETRDISRFKGPDSYVRYCGIAPRESSSGKRIKFKKTKSGNRRLNQTIYFITLSQIRTNPKVKEYFIRKISEGKSRKQAICCIMRRIAVIIYGMLRTKGAWQAHIQ